MSLEGQGEAKVRGERGTVGSARHVDTDEDPTPDRIPFPTPPYLSVFSLDLLR